MAFLRLSLALVVTVVLAVHMSVAPGQSHAQAPLDPYLASAVQQLVAQAGDAPTVNVVIELTGPDLSVACKDDVTPLLMEHAGRTQGPVLSFLAEHHVSVLNRFWLNNAILADVPLDLLDDIARLPAVEDVFENYEVTIAEPAASSVTVSSSEVTWGLDRVHAPEVWDMGVTGAGVRVAVLDTGVDVSHPDLSGKMWTDDPSDATYPGGWIEFGASGTVVSGSTPYDTHFHGTHTSGTVLGGNASGTAIGVAPGAWLMHALILPNGSGSFAQVLAGMQWAVNPVDQYGNPAGEPADVVSMSFGSIGYYEEMIEPVLNMVAAGIVPVASIGNEGEGTSGGPGNVYECFGIGATDSNDYVASFSSGEVVDWPASYYEPYIKPDFSAPGSSVLSSVPDGGYEYHSGTSMAAPHAAGVVALMLEGNSDLGVDDVYDALRSTADDLGATGKDIGYGWGIVDAFEAVAQVSLDCGIDGVVSDADTTLPIEGAEVMVSETGQSKYTDAAGGYRFFLPPGDYTVSASGFGYEPQAVVASVAEGVHTPQDFSLVPMPSGTISGTVTDVDTGQPLEGVTVRVVDAPRSTVTNVQGGYSMDVPVGTYDVAASMWGYKPASLANIEVLGGQTVQADIGLVETIRVAILGDYRSELVQLLRDAHMSAEEREWDVVDDMARYDAVVVNCPPDPGGVTFLDLLNAADSFGVGCVFTSSWTGTGQLYGISLLRTYVGDPGGYGHDYSKGAVYYEVAEAHPLFAGWEPGDRVDLIVSGGGDHAWYVGYSGQTVAHIGAEEAGIRGGGVGIGAMGESLHILLAGLGPQRYASLANWTQDAKTIFVRALLLAGGEPQMCVEPASMNVALGRDQLVSRTMAIGNAGGGALEFALSDTDLATGVDAAWLSASVTSGTVTAQGEGEVEIFFDTSGLDVAEYSAQITIDCNDAARPQVIVPVTMTVTNTVPDISVTPLSFDEAVDADQVATATMTVHNLGDGTLDISISDVDSSSGLDAPWLSEEPTSSSVGPGGYQNVTITFDTHGLDFGAYAADILVDSNDPDEGTVAVPVSLAVPEPDIEVSVPEPLEAVLEQGQTDTRTFVISNLGNGMLQFEIDTDCVVGLTTSESGGAGDIPYLALGKGEDDPRSGELVIQGVDGPDGFGYYWIDSDEPGGPLYEWTELEGTGTDSGIHVDDDAAVVDIGFDFSFYGNVYTQVMIAEDGYLSFADYGGSAYTNQPIPHDAFPNGIIAAFWDDHYTPAGGAILYDTVVVGGQTAFVVEWHEVPLYSDPVGSSLTYQIVLTSDGEVLLRYEAVSGDEGAGQSASLGTENADGSDGLCVSFNTAYVHDGLSVLVAAHPFWLRVEPQSGAVGPGGSQEITVTFDARGLSAGTLSGNILIASNDPDESALGLAASLEVLEAVGPPTPDFYASPTAGLAPLDVQFSDQSTGDVVAWLWDFGDGQTSAERNPLHEYAGAGTYTVSLTVTDSTSGHYTEAKEGYIVADRAGDANQDGNINALDMTMAERIIIGVESPTPGADANGDGCINALDITRIELVMIDG